MSDFWRIEEIPYDPINPVPAIDIEAELREVMVMDIPSVEAISRRLEAKWTVADVEALKTTHNLDLEQELCDILQQEIRKEWEAENGMTYEQHDEMLLKQLIAVAKEHGLIPND